MKRAELEFNSELCLLVQKNFTGKQVCGILICMCVSTVLYILNFSFLEDNTKYRYIVKKLYEPSNVPIYCTYTYINNLGVLHMRSPRTVVGIFLN